MSTTELNEPEMKIFVDKSLGSNHKVISFLKQLLYINQHKYSKSYGILENWESKRFATHTLNKYNQP